MHQATYSLVIFLEAVRKEISCVDLMQSFLMGPREIFLCEIVSIGGAITNLGNFRLRPHLVTNYLPKLSLYFNRRNWGAGG